MTSVGQEAHPIRNPSHYNPKPSEASKPDGIILEPECAAGMTAEQQAINRNGINTEGWPIPKLSGLIPYSIQVEKVDGVEKIVERFYLPDGSHVARIKGNGKVFAYVVDHDREPPADYLLLNPDGFGRFTQKIRPQDSYRIPEWVSR